MAVRNIAVTDTIEKFRTEFNAMTLNDFGDIANLDASLTATNLVDAMNETLSVATNTAGFRIEDSSSTQQLIGGGEVMRILGTTNQTTAVVSATDTLTASLDSTITGLTSLTSTALVGSTSVTAGTLFLTENRIRTTDSSVLNLNDTVSITSAGAISGVSTLAASSDITINSISVATRPFAIAQAVALG